MLSKRLKILRENCGYTQQQIADALNIDRSTYTYYETGKTSPDIHAIVKLAKIFNVSYSDILDDETPNSSVRDPLMKSMGRYGGKNAYNIYELSKQEKRLIIYFRLLPAEARDQLIDIAHDLLGHDKKREKGADAQKGDAAGKLDNSADKKD